MATTGRSHWLFWLTALLQFGAVAAGIGSGIGHTVSITNKIAGDRLEAVQEPPTLYAIGAILVLAGLGAAFGLRALLRTRRARAAIFSSAGLLLTVLAISFIFNEFRGLPMTAPPALALAGTLFYASRGSPAAG